MTNADTALLQAIWLQLAEDEFSKEKLADRVLRDGGTDMSDLSQEDLIALLEGRFHGDWQRPAFSFSELLAYYRACGKEMTPHQIVGWVFASFVIADAIKQNAAEWERQFDNFINGFITINEHLEVAHSVQIIQRVFCGNLKCS